MTTQYIQTSNEEYAITITIKDFHEYIEQAGIKIPESQTAEAREKGLKESLRMQREAQESARKQERLIGNSNIWRNI